MVANGELHVYAELLVYQALRVAPTFGCAYLKDHCLHAAKFSVRAGGIKDSFFRASQWGVKRVWF